jgi:hypothetical protein
MTKMDMGKPGAQPHEADITKGFCPFLACHEVLRSAIVVNGKEGNPGSLLALHSCSSISNEMLVCPAYCSVYGSLHHPVLSAMLPLLLCQVNLCDTLYNLTASNGQRVLYLNSADLGLFNGTISKRYMVC